LCLSEILLLELPAQTFSRMRIFGTIKGHF
jgi:hypothetical protein